MKDNMQMHSNCSGHNVEEIHFVISKISIYSRVHIRRIHYINIMSSPWPHNACMSKKRRMDEYNTSIKSPPTCCFQPPNAALEPNTQHQHFSQHSHNTQTRRSERTKTRTPYTPSHNRHNKTFNTVPRTLLMEKQREQTSTHTTRRGCLPSLQVGTLTLSATVYHPQRDVSSMECSKVRYSHRPFSIFSCTKYRSQLKQTNVLSYANDTITFFQQPDPHTAANKLQDNITYWSSASFKQNKSLPLKFYTRFNNSLDQRIQATTHKNTQQHSHTLDHHGYHTRSDMQQTQIARPTHC